MSSPLQLLPLKNMTTAMIMDNAKFTVTMRCPRNAFISLINTDTNNLQTRCDVRRSFIRAFSISLDLDKSVCNRSCMLAQ